MFIFFSDLGENEAPLWSGGQGLTRRSNRRKRYNTCIRVHTHTVYEYRPDNCLSFHALFWLSPLVPPQNTREKSMGQCVTVIIVVQCTV